MLVESFILYYFSVLYILVAQAKHISSSKQKELLNKVYFKFNSKDSIKPKDSHNFIRKREKKSRHHGVSIKETRRFVYYSAAAYCEIKDIKPWGCRNCVGDTNSTRTIMTISNKKTDTFAYIALNEYHREIIVSFRGTNGKTNMIKNFLLWYDYLFYNNRKIKVHYGFLQMTQSLYPQLEEKLLELKNVYPNYNVKLTGHSMGGALALLSSVYLLNNEIVTSEYLEVVTYGQPRVGNFDFVKYVNSNLERVSRVTNKNDIVPLLPINYFGYYHTKNEIYINSEGTTRECSNEDIEDSTCISGAGFVKSLKAHFRYWDLTIFSNC